MPGALARLDARIARRKAERVGIRPQPRTQARATPATKLRLSDWQRERRAEQATALAAWRAANPQCQPEPPKGWRKGASHARWRGGTFVNHAGYRMARVDGRYRLEHRIVMERLLGRALMPWETVHHKNGVRTDNRPENLEHRSSRHGPGQRVADLPAQGQAPPFWRLASRPAHLTAAGRCG